MTKIVFVLLYLWKGEITLIKKPTPNYESCLAGAKSLAKELNDDPRFGGAYFADCVELEVTEAKK